MPDPAKLGPIVPRPGVPLYRDVRDAMVDAIRAGIFHPGDRIPTTKQLSQQLSVSLVTAHRAMQELVASGHLERTQGRGTFVRDFEKEGSFRHKLGIVLNPLASMADFYYSQILEGMCQACRAQDIELLMMHPTERAELGCQGYMCLNLSPEMLKKVYQLSKKHAPVVAVGEKSDIKQVTTIDVDNVDLATKAVEYLYELGHRRIGYVGSNNERSHSKDRREGFTKTCKRLGIKAKDVSMCDAADWRLNNDEKGRLTQLLNQDNRPTAILSGGYYLALDVYAAAARLGLAIPKDLSVIGVDDPPSAAHLSPALTTMRQPLVELGHTAATIAEGMVGSDQNGVKDHALRAELIIRGSTAGC
ncbi:MAG: GntR family transcriptional regulator [Phycisphaeraceae bacterium]